MNASLGGDDTEIKLSEGASIFDRKQSGMDESIPCDVCEGTGTVGTNQDTCPPCRGHGKRFVYRPVATIVHVPTLRVPCGCGRVFDSGVPEVVKEFQRTHVAPSIECGCGRVVMGQRRLVSL